jgi:hypothetical protein
MDEVDFGLTVEEEFDFGGLHHDLFSVCEKRKKDERLFKGKGKGSKRAQGKRQQRGLP